MDTDTFLLIFLYLIGAIVVLIDNNFFIKRNKYKSMKTFIIKFSKHPDYGIPMGYEVGVEGKDVEDAIDKFWKTRNKEEWNIDSVFLDPEEE